MSGYFSDRGGLPRRTPRSCRGCRSITTWVCCSGSCAPVSWACARVLTSPVAFLQRPARWMQLMASNGHVYTAGPNFAFELAARKTSDEDMAGPRPRRRADDRHRQRAGTSGDPAPLHRAVRPLQSARDGDPAVLRSGGGDGLRGDPRTGRAAEDRPLRLREAVRGAREAAAGGRGTPLVSYGVPRGADGRGSWTRDPHRVPGGTTGEIWVHGDNVAAGYWGQAEEDREHVRRRARRRRRRHARGALAANR